MLHIVIFIGFLLAWKRKIIIDFLKSILKYYYPDRKSSRIQIISTMKFERITSNFEKCLAIITIVQKNTNSVQSIIHQLTSFALPESSSMLRVKISRN